jgi:hypothetical protein
MVPRCENHGHRMETIVNRLHPSRWPLDSDCLDRPAAVQKQLVGWFGAHHVHNFTWARVRAEP